MKSCASIVEQPELMPNYPPARALRRGIDLAYGRRQITASVTSSILQGRSLRGIADDLQQRITTMDRTSAIRTARTAFTGAQNAGRMDSYAAAEKMDQAQKRVAGDVRRAHAAFSRGAGRGEGRHGREVFQRLPLPRRPAGAARRSL